MYNKFSLTTQNTLKNNTVKNIVATLYSVLSTANNCGWHIMLSRRDVITTLLVEV